MTASSSAASMYGNSAQRRAQRYPPPPATAIFRQSSGTMAHGMSRAGTTMDNQKNGLPSR